MPDAVGMQVILVAESFGGCLGLRVAKAAPLLVERMVLVNPATSFARSYARLPSLVAATGLLSIFPEQLYQVRDRMQRVPLLKGLPRQLTITTAHAVRMLLTASHLACLRCRLHRQSWYHFWSTR